MPDRNAENKKGKPSDMEGFSSPSRTWFEGAFEAPTNTQIEAWRAISAGDNALVVAPTGSGKTLAAFMWAIDRLSQETSTPEGNRTPEETSTPEEASAPEENSPQSSHATAGVKPAGEGSLGDARQKVGGQLGPRAGKELKKGVKVLYISPLKALGVDVERNLQAPLAGIREATKAAGSEPPNLKVGVRSGDTPQSERRRQATNPPDILITTPESLYLLLTSKAAETLRSVDTVIIDEVHALAGNKRGAHLALSLERLDMLTAKPVQRIGLSATVEPASEVARFLGGPHPATIVEPKADKKFEITVDVPVQDMTNPPQPEELYVSGDSAPEDHRLGSMWPAIERSLYGRITAAKSTIVFTNSRRLAERLTTALNRIHSEQVGAEAVIARSHHGSVSKEQRSSVEEALKDGSLRCVVATSSLELGIDMGEVDLVVQIDPPPSVSSGMQRLGRSGHQVGAESKVVFYPTHRSKLIETAAIAQRMNAAEIEPMKVLANPLDVLAQQTIAASVASPLGVDEWFATVRRAAPYRDLPESAYLGVLDLISGRYPSTDLSNLRARVDWDRHKGTITARPGAQRLAVTSGGTIPDRGMYRVVTAGGEAGGSRVGELDEEMVYETRVGEVFTLGTTPWRVRQITKDRVEVEPAFGQVGKVPFWRGDAPSRPYSLGQGVGSLAGSLGAAEAGEALDILTKIGFTTDAATNTVTYLAEQVEHTGRVPSASTLMVERSRDEVGDWLYILHSPFGLSVHSPWSLAINARLADRWGLQTKAVASNDGIIVRVPDMDLGSGEPPQAGEIFLFDPEEIDAIIRDEVENSAVFASRFREVAARALILGGSLPGKRSPLWQQRLRASALLEVAANYSDFPMILETMREVLQDVYDTGALRKVLTDVHSRKTGFTEIITETPSPFARSLLFGYVGEFMYEGDTPSSERRLAALSVDPQMLSELLGEVALKDLLEAEAIRQVISELQRTKPGWQLKGSTGVLDLLRTLGPLTAKEIGERIDPSSGDHMDLIGDLLVNRQAYEARLGGQVYLAAMEDAGLLAHASGTPPPQGVPSAFLNVQGDPLRSLVVRYAATNGPFTAEGAAARFQVAQATMETTLRSLAEEGRVLRGRFLPDELFDYEAGPDSQWVAKPVLEKLRSRSLALLRGAVEPVGRSSYARFLTRWQYADSSLNGVDGAHTVVEQLAGVYLPASTWETLVFPQRVRDYKPHYLESLVSSGEVHWVGFQAIGSTDGWVAFYPAGVDVFNAPDEGAAGEPMGDLAAAILEALAQRGALFAPAIAAEVGSGVSEPHFEEAMWDLVWRGKITSDSVSALRAKVSGRRSAQKTNRRRSRARSWGRAHTSATRQGVSSLSQQPSLAGRWSLTESLSGALSDSAADFEEASSTALTVWLACMLDRYGVVTRGAVASEQFPGGFAAAYRLLAQFEQEGACQRGYFIEGLGAAQFALPGAVDYLREVHEETQKGGMPSAVTLSATDPANPYGAALPWPPVEGDVSARPKRNPGALVSMLDGKPALYLERGGKTALTFEGAETEGEGPSEQHEGPDGEACREATAKSMVGAARAGHLATFTIEKVGGEPVGVSPWEEAFLAAGFEKVPRGVVLRKRIM